MGVKPLTFVGSEPGRKPTRRFAHRLKGCPLNTSAGDDEYSSSRLSDLARIVWAHENAKAGQC